MYHLPWAINLPLAGTLINLNLLPILLTIATYYQTKLMPTSMGASATPQQASQQKMMKYMSPAMMLVFLYNAPAGLNLYVMTSTFSSVFEQIIIRKHIQEKEPPRPPPKPRWSRRARAPAASGRKNPKAPSGPNAGDYVARASCPCLRFCLCCYCDKEETEETADTGKMPVPQKIGEHPCTLKRSFRCFW